MTDREDCFAVIVDLVGSRQHTDRRWVHREFVAAMERVNAHVPSIEALVPTLGDEAQGRYGSLADAVMATLLLRLHLPAGLDARAGIGAGVVEQIGTGVVGLVQDGPGWWAARDAIVEAKAREVARHRSLRTWYRVAAPHGGAARPDVDEPAERLVNAYLVVRDHVVTGMSERSRRLLLGLMQGLSRTQLAEAEQIPASAVSQNLRRSGVFAVLDAHEQLFGDGQEPD